MNIPSDLENIIKFGIGQLICGSEAFMKMKKRWVHSDFGNSDAPKVDYLSAIFRCQPFNPTYKEN